MALGRLYNCLFVADSRSHRYACMAKNSNGSFFISNNCLGSSVIYFVCFMFNYKQKRESGQKYNKDFANISVHISCIMHITMYIWSNNVDILINRKSLYVVWLNHV